MVVVVAEGAGDALLDGGVAGDLGTDQSGNKKMADIGSLLKNRIVSHGK
jgi:hypothetical protein